jgi:hypothetical protein
MRELDGAFFHLYLPTEANREWRIANREWGCVQEDRSGAGGAQAPLRAAA